MTSRSPSPQKQHSWLRWGALAGVVTFALALVLAGLLNATPTSAHHKPGHGPEPTPTPTPEPTPTPTPEPPSPASWTLTGSLATARTGHAAARLPDGRVLVTGGWDGSFDTNSAELYDPATGTWSPTGNMLQGSSAQRKGHTATLLPDGRVLVAGLWPIACNIEYGCDPETVDDNSAEIYDPTTNTWTATGEMIYVRANHIAALLPDSRVLVAGGTGRTAGTDFTAEIYDPATGTWTATGSLNQRRGSGHAAAMLPDGRVLVSGGPDVSSAEIYDPATGTWTFVAEMNSPRRAHTMTLLNDGRVLAAGSGGGTSELYDPATDGWSLADDMNVARSGHTATLLESGQVLAAGGSSGGPINSAEIYTP